MSELGSRLIRAREVRGLTLEDAERDTRISRRYLQALETEQFDLIPAPVYARGFLRSYSQYLGMDPQEVLSLFPRDGEGGYASPPPPPSHRPVQREPIQPVGGGERPVIRRQRQDDGQERLDRVQRPEVRREPGRPVPQVRREYQGQYIGEQEPTIGADIGVPAPARRLKTDPAAQTRSLTVLIVAVGAIIAVVLLAFIISRVGGGGSDPRTPGVTATTAASGANPASGAANKAGANTPAAGNATAATTSKSAVAGQNVAVPSVKGKTEADAKAALEAAGFTVNIFPGGDSGTKGTVTDQSPAPDVQWPAGSSVTIVVSQGS
jgi:cytoskeletal protein RodZ